MSGTEKIQKNIEKIMEETIEELETGLHKLEDLQGVKEWYKGFDDYIASDNKEGE